MRLKYGSLFLSHVSDLPNLHLYIKIYNYMRLYISKRGASNTTKKLVVFFLNYFIYRNIQVIRASDVHTNI